jgi:hypothetical protein
VEQLFDFVRRVIGLYMVVVGNSLGSVVGLGHGKTSDLVGGDRLVESTGFFRQSPFRLLLEHIEAQPIGALVKRVITWPPIFVPFFAGIRGLL